MVGQVGQLSGQASYGTGSAAEIKAKQAAPAVVELVTDIGAGEQVGLAGKSAPLTTGEGRSNPLVVASAREATPEQQQNMAEAVKGPEAQVAVADEVSLNAGADPLVEKTVAEIQVVINETSLTDGQKLAGNAEVAKPENAGKPVLAVVAKALNMDENDLDAQAPGLSRL